MKTTTMPKQDSMKLVIQPVTRANFLPIATQIRLAKQARRYDKSRSRAKSKQWQKDF